MCALLAPPEHPVCPHRRWPLDGHIWQVSVRFPELTSALPIALGGRSAVLDCEVCAMDDASGAVLPAPSALGRELSDSEMDRLWDGLACESSPSMSPSTSSKLIVDVLRSCKV